MRRAFTPRTLRRGSRLTEQAARVAGVLVLLDGETAAEVGENQFARAIEIVRHHAFEALRLARAGVVEPELRQARRLLDWLSNGWPEPCASLPDIYQRGPHGIRDKATASRLVRVLEDHARVTKVEGGATIGGTHRREVWAIYGKGGPA
jgi:hypothetical protein